MENTSLRGIENKRKENFLIMHSKLAIHNQLCHADNFMSGPISLVNGPLCYPFLSIKGKKTPLRSKLANKNIFIPMYWTDSPTISSFAEDLIGNLLPLPIDQRLSDADIQHVAKEVLSLC